MFDWRVLRNGKVEWKSTCLECGALLLTLSGPVRMLRWSAETRDTSNQVEIKK